MTPQTGGERLPWFNTTLRQILISALGAVPVANTQTPCGTAPGQGTGAGFGENGLACVGSTCAAIKALFTVSVTVLSQGRALPGQRQAVPQLAQAGTAAIRAPSLAAWLMLPEMLKARPNQKIDIRNRNSTGNTKAASAISAPALSRNESKTPDDHPLTGKELASNPTPSEQEDFMPSKCPPRVAGSIKQNRNRCCHSERDFRGVGIFYCQLRA